MELCSRPVFRAIAAAASLVLASGGALAQKLATLEIEGRLREQPGAFDWLMGGEPTMRSVIETLTSAGAEGDLTAIVVRLKDAELNRTQVEELGVAIDMVRTMGKKVYLFSEAYGADELLLAAHADKALIQSGGEVSLPGLSMQEMYLADTLSWLGVKADMVQVGDFKGANEMYVNAQPSKAWDQNINQLLDSLYANMRTALKKGRHMSDERLDDAMKRAWMADAQEAVDVGLIDAAVDLPKLGEYITGKEGAEWVDLDAATESTLKLDTSNPFTALPNLMKALAEPPSQSPKSDSIAVVHIDGAIGDGDSTPGGLFGEETVGSRTVRNALEEIRDEEKVKGVIVRIDSPGGSATASEIIWQGVRRLAEKKPVWVSVGSMAASGGYYIAVAGDRIYLNPSSIVGSIGVVGGKFSMGGLYEKGKVHVVERSRGPMGDMFNTVTPWSPEQLAQVRAKMKRTYDLFASRVAAGRKGIDLAQTAEGRLFAGQKAIDMRMADHLGGLDECLEDLADELKLDDYEVLDYPGPKSFQDLLKDMAGRFGVASPRLARGAAGPSALASEFGAVGRELLGDRAWGQVRASVGAMMQLRKEPVILAMPRAIILK